MKYKSVFSEAEESKVDVEGIIKDVIESKWSGSNEEQLRVIQLLKGLATSDDAMANKFMKYLDDFTSKMSIEDFKSKSGEKKESKK